MKQIANYPDYFITEKGCVYSQRGRHRLKRLKPYDKGDGYYSVQLYKDNGKPNNLYVHRLVCDAFLDNPKNKKTVNHKDGNRWNNLINNLEWATQKENMQHAVAVLKSEFGIRRAVVATNILTNVSCKYRSIADAVRDLRLPILAASDITQVCRGKRKQTRGYRWKYVSGMEVSDD